MNSYAKTTWVDNDIPALDAQNLNHIEDGIYAVTEEVRARGSSVKYKEDVALDRCTDADTVYNAAVDSKPARVFCVKGQTNWAQYAFTPAGLYMRICPATSGNQSGAWQGWQKVTL